MTRGGNEKITSIYHVETTIFDRIVIILLYYECGGSENVFNW